LAETLCCIVFLVFFFIIAKACYRAEIIAFAAKKIVIKLLGYTFLLVQWVIVKKYCNIVMHVNNNN
jgi:hypothetical protein